MFPGRGAAPTSRRQQHRRRSDGFAKDVVLGAGALLGLIAVGWVLYAQVTGALLVSFRTGSMAPSLPQGAAAISVPTPAADLSVGDVVTVRREPAAPPITHRVVDIEPIPGQPGSREVRLQGDANATPDLEPYVIDEVPRVVWGADWFGAALSWAQTTWFRVLVVLGIGLLITWAFWPAPDVDEHGEGGNDEREGGRV